MNRVFTVRRLRSWCLAALLGGVSMAQAVSATDAAASRPAEVPAAHSELFATVNGKPILSSEYETAFAALVRQKFYHGTIPEGQLDLARDEVKNKLVHRILLLEEADRRGISADQKEVDETIAGYDSRYASSPQWQENRERLLPDLKKQLNEQSQLARLERTVRQTPEPNDAAVRAYYDSHPDFFTEPEKLRLSIILLKVDPSSPATAWQQTREEAQAIYRRLMSGSDFSEAARLHSSAKSEEGGDLGYLHRGMLPDPLQSRIDSFEIGKVTEPMDILEGVAIFRLSERLPPKKRDFADVAKRARDLLIREQQDQAWKSLLDKLVESADIKIHSQLGKGQREGGGS